MKVQSILNRFKPKFVNIHTNEMPAESAKSLESARGMLENYAKHKQISIDVYGGQRLLENDFMETFPGVASGFKKQLQIVVEDLKTKNYGFSLVPADTKSSTVNSKLKPFVIDDLSEGTQYVRNGKHSYEDSFLRNVYRNIENLTKKVKNKK